MHLVGRDHFLIQVSEARTHETSCASWLSLSRTGRGSCGASTTDQSSRGRTYLPGGGPSEPGGTTTTPTPRSCSDTGKSTFPAPPFPTHTSVTAQLSHVVLLAIYHHSRTAS